MNMTKTKTQTPTMVAAMVTIPNPQAAVFTSPRTCPRQLFKCVRRKADQREFLLTPNFYRASRFIAEAEASLSHN